MSNIANRTPGTSQDPQTLFPMNRWWVAGFSSELTDRPLARVLLNRPMVLFRNAAGQVGALQDRCCHKELPLSCGSVEGAGLRCGYHGLLFDTGGTCIEIPGQQRIPPKARVPSYPLVEQDKLLWVWIGDAEHPQPVSTPPRYAFHDEPSYRYGSGAYHYDAPYQLIHDNLMDLSHLGYVHLKTIGGNARIHMNAELKVDGNDDMVRVVRWMPDSVPPPTYLAAWPFKGKVDRWQEIEFNISHLCIWTGAMDVGSDKLDNPARYGFHMRGFHGVTPETETTSHYFWSMATNPEEDVEAVTNKVVEQTVLTFDEDKIIIEAQYRNQLKFAERSTVDIHVDVGPNRARRIIDRLIAEQQEAV